LLPIHTGPQVCYPQNLAQGYYDVNIQQGSIGPSGPSGPSGANGANGATGLTGPTGTQVSCYSY
jgi:hypothetical protein